MATIQIERTVNGTYDFYIDGVKVKQNLSIAEVANEITQLEGEANDKT